MWMLSLMSCVTLGKQLDLSVLPIPYLQNGVDYIGLQWAHACSALFSVVSGTQDSIPIN